MATFAEFLINLMQKLGIYYVFSILFLTLITFVLSVVLLKKFSSGVLDEKRINTISMLLAISVAILSSSLYRIVDMFSYFLAMFSTMAVIILFSFAILIFITDKKPTVSDTGARNIFILILVFLAAFIFISFYFAFQDILIPLVYGEGTKSAGSIYDVFSYIFRAEILIIPFLFAIIGLALMVLGSLGPEQSQKK